MLGGESVLEAVESLLYAPALVVQIADDGGREMHGVEQVGHQDTDLAGGGDVALHLAFVLVLAMQGSGQHHFRAGQIQAECNLIGCSGPRDMTGAQPKAHGGGIGRNQAQAMPVRHPSVALGTC